MSQDRATFQRPAEQRLAEAELLLANRFWSGAYYLAGYSLECALKAKIASSFRENEIPELRRVQKIYSHDLSSLLGLSGLKDELEAEMEANVELRKYWTIVKEWSEQARYEIWTQERASAILEAVSGDRIATMVPESIVSSKLDASTQLAERLIGRGAPLLAAYWEFREELGRWTLVLVPASPNDDRSLIKEATDLLVEPPFRSIFSISEPSVDSRQIKRARALGAYSRVEPFIGRRIDDTFTGGEYFGSVVPIYLARKLMTHLHVA